MAPEDPKRQEGRPRVDPDPGVPPTELAAAKARRRRSQRDARGSQRAKPDPEHVAGAVDDDSLDGPAEMMCTRAQRRRRAPL